MDDIEIKSINGIVDRFESDKAIIKLDDGQEILWPKDKLTSEIKEGSVVKLVAFSDLSLTEHREEIAKNILKEIFNSDD